VAAVVASSGNALASASTTISWSFPSTQPGDVVIIFFQSASTGSLTLSSPPQDYVSWQGRLPAGTANFPFYAYTKTSLGGETSATATATDSAAYWYGYVVVRGTNLYRLDFSSFHSVNASSSSTTLDGYVGSLLVAIDGCESTTSNTCDTTTATPSLTVTELFDTGSVGSGLWVAAYSAPYTSTSFASLQASTVRSAAPTGSVHTTLWGVWTEGPPIPSLMVTRAAQVRASLY
jgi:hypothetical protein